jgi:hypothetical protein
MDDDINLALSFAGRPPPDAPPGGPQPPASVSPLGSPSGATTDPLGQVAAWARNASPQQRAQAAEQLGHLAEISAAIGSRSPDPTVRLSLARHMATLHPQYGVDPTGLDVSQFTDGAMRAQFAQQLAARSLLQGGSSPTLSNSPTPSNWETTR